VSAQNTAIDETVSNRVVREARILLLLQSAEHYTAELRRAWADSVPLVRIATLKSQLQSVRSELWSLGVDLGPES
jgi:hypothetical protein